MAHQEVLVGAMHAMQDMTALLLLVC